MKTTSLNNNESNALKPVTQTIFLDYAKLYSLYLRQGKLGFKLTDEMLESLHKLATEYDWRDRVFTENGKKGLRDVVGNLLVPAEFDDIIADTEYDEFAASAIVKKDGHWGLVKRDGKGTVVTPFEYCKIQRSPYFDFFLVVKDEDPKHFAVMRNNQVLTPYELDTIYESMNGLLYVGIGKKVGLVTDRGSAYIRPEYDEIYPDDDNQYYIFEKDGVKGYVTQDGRFISLEDYAQMPESERDDLELITFEMD